MQTCSEETFPGPRSERDPWARLLSKPISNVPPGTPQIECTHDNNAFNAEKINMENRT